ncbi:MAG: potassium channel family protein [Methylacidiphilales bacterium]|nr:potassium channel family protein [Candidatus Methylacidiphilales bacterium]
MNQSKNLWVRASRVRFFWLLVTLIGVILTVPALPDSVGGEWESAGLGVVIVFAASYVSRGLQRFWVVVFLVLILIAAVGLNTFYQDSIATRALLFSILLIILSLTAIRVLTFVLDAGKVSAEHIYGAICAYVLIAMAFATLDFILESLEPGSFSGVHARTITDRGWWQLFYFSFTTLSTVGYGDIVPMTMRARSFVIIEQLVAVFYVAILIARLTGMYSSERKSEDDH